MVVGITLSCRKETHETENAPKIEWMKTFGGPDWAEGKSIIQDFNGNFVIAGSSNSNNSDRIHEAYLGKIDKKGNVLWSETFHHSGRSAWIEEVQQSSDGGYILVGGMMPMSGLGYTNVYSIQTDKNGKLIWSKIHGEKKHDRAFCVIEDSNGDFVIGGSTCSFGESARHLQMDVYIIGINDKGDTIWTNVYEEKGNEGCNSLQRCDDGGYLLVGYYGPVLYLMKTDDNGDSLWTKKYGGENLHYVGNCIKKTSDGGYIIAGYTLIKKWPRLFGQELPFFPIPIPVLSRMIIEYFGWGYFSDFYLLRIDENGNIIWTKMFGRKYHDEAYSVQETTDGGFNVAGYTGNSLSPPGVDPSGYIVRTDENGEIIWETKLCDKDEMVLYSIIQTSDGGYAATGVSNAEAILIKLKPEK